MVRLITEKKSSVSGYHINHYIQSNAMVCLSLINSQEKIIYYLFIYLLLFKLYLPHNLNQYALITTEREF